MVYTVLISRMYFFLDISKYLSYFNFLFIDSLMVTMLFFKNHLLGMLQYFDDISIVVLVVVNFYVCHMLYGTI